MLHKGREVAAEIEKTRKQQRLGHRVVHYQSCDSTQTRLLNQLEQGALPGTVVMADHQTAGKGRQGRSWFSHQGGLQFSVACAVSLPIAKAPRMTLLTGVALLDVLRQLQCDAFVKWPNDILLPAKEPGPLGNYRKIGGILVELTCGHDRVDVARIGIGLNDQTPIEEFPSEIRLIAGALPSQIASQGRVFLMDKILNGLQKWVMRADSEEIFAEGLELLRTHSSLLGRQVRVPEEGVMGRVVDIDHDGALLVELDSGGRRRVMAGDVWPTAGTEPSTDGPDSVPT